MVLFTLESTQKKQHERTQERVRIFHHSQLNHESEKKLLHFLAKKVTKWWITPRK